MRAIFLSEVQKKITNLPSRERQEIRILTWMNEKEYRSLFFEIPASEYMADLRELYGKYVLAMINNMTVSFGGAGMEIFCDTKDVWLVELLEEVIQEFQVKSNRNDRTGYGVYLNYINRMNVFLGLDRFFMDIKDLKEWPDLSEKKRYEVYEPHSERKEIELLKRSALELKERCICSLDVGGNSIKGAVVTDGKVDILKEYQWYPTGCKIAEEMNGPMVLMIRFLALYSSLPQSERCQDAYMSGFRKDTTYDELSAICRQMEAAGYHASSKFDAVVIGFPDIVVNNKIAGGESFKQLGLKNNPDTDYEIEFFKTSDIDDQVRGFAKDSAPVIVLNDGNAASYITSVEQAFADNSIIDENGMFACTIGTEMGTGLISRGGTIQQIPLEGFQHVIDLGNEEYQKYPPNDLRSINSTNTGISGVIQKYISQMGLFRMVITKAWENQDPLFDELLQKELVFFDQEKDFITAMVTEGKDRRGDLTKYLVSKLDEGHPLVVDAYKTMGKAMGILIDQDILIFPEITTTRLVSGGVIANNKAYELFCTGLKEYNAFYNVIRLDEKATYTPLLKNMRPDERNFNVAIGSAFIGNRFLVEKNN